MNGRSMDRLAHRVALVMSGRPARRRALMARLRMDAMILGPDRVLTCDLSSWYRVSRSQWRDSGDKGSAFYLPTPPSKRESQFMALIGSKVIVILMTCLLGAVFVIVLVLLVTRV